MTADPRADCGLAEVPSDRYFEQLAARPAGPDDLPLAGSIELTHRCNMRCAHCYLPAGQGGRELSQADWKRVLDILSGHGVLFLLITGGEPFIREDFGAIYEAAQERGFIITLFTTGTRMSESDADFLARRPPRRVELTVYGCTPPTWDTVTGTAGLFPSFMRSLDRLRERRVPVALKMLVTKANFHEIAAVRCLAETYGAAIRFDPVVTARLDGSLAPTHVRVHAREAAEARRVQGVAASLEVPAEEQVAIPLFRCGAGTRTFNVDPFGHVHPCLMWRRAPFQILERPVSEWNAFIRGLRARSLPRDSACGRCADRVRCPVCPALAGVETGCEDAPVPYFCQLAGRS